MNKQFAFKLIAAALVVLALNLAALMYNFGQHLKEHQSLPFRTIITITNTAPATLLTNIHISVYQKSE